MKTVAVTDFLTQHELALAYKLKKADAIYNEITLPNIARINETLGQENDAKYLAYAIENVVAQATGKARGANHA